MRNNLSFVFIPHFGQTQFLLLVIPHTPSSLGSEGMGRKFFKKKKKNLNSLFMDTVLLQQKKKRSFPGIILQTRLKLQICEDIFQSYNTRWWQGWASNQISLLYFSTGLSCMHLVTLLNVRSTAGSIKLICLSHIYFIGSKIRQSYF